MSQEDINYNYITSDLALVTAISLFLPIDEIDKTNPRKAQFIFRHDKKRLDELLNKYWNRELLVDPRAYFDQLKALKVRLYASE